MLRPIQNLFDPAAYPDLLVGLGDPDDAAVWRLDDSHALVVTTDFFNHQFGVYLLKIGGAWKISDIVCR